MGNTNMPSEAQWVELNALLQKLFDAVDTDKTGKLSAANMEEAADKMVEHQMASQAPPEGLTEEQVKAAMDGKTNVEGRHDEGYRRSIGNMRCRPRWAADSGGGERRDDKDDATRA